jgi:hypothetical protein
MRRLVAVKNLLLASFALLLLQVALASTAQAQATPAPETGVPAAATLPATSPPPTASPVTPPAELESLAWLAGCWRGTVNQREFREHWMPLRGGLLLGVTQTVVADKTQDYAYLRLEKRPDGAIYFTNAQPGQKELVFRFVPITGEQQDKMFGFVNTLDAFPQHIIYQRGGEGWLYATVEGKLNGEDRKVIYPMRRIGCESGEFITK